MWKCGDLYKVDTPISKNVAAPMTRPRSALLPPLLLLHLLLLSCA